MKRELKGKQLTTAKDIEPIIAKLIPMKRELKASHPLGRNDGSGWDRKADPDEKGTESISSASLA